MALIFRGLKKYPDGLESGFVSYPEGDEPPPASNGLLNDLVAQWEFNGDGDDSHAAQDLSLNNSPTFTTGKLADAVQCAAASASYLSRFDVALILPNGDWSLAGWVKFTSLAVANPVLSSSNPSLSQDASLLYEASGVYGVNELVYGCCGEVFPSGFTPLVNTWYFLVLQRSGADVELWVDGSMVNSNPLSSPAAGDLGSELFFGLDNFSGVTSDALFDSWGYRTAVLDSAKVSSLYNSGNGLPYESFTS